jgi:hypothetical protein
MNRLMKRLEKAKKSLAIAAARRAGEQRADNQSSRLKALLRQIRRLALGSSTLTMPDLNRLRDIFRSESTREFNSKELASLDRFRTLCEQFSKELTGEPFSVIEQKVKVDPLDLVRDIDRELAISDLGNFVRQAWDVVVTATGYLTP